MTVKEMEKFISKLAPERKDQVMLCLLADLRVEGIVDSVKELSSFLEEAQDKLESCREEDQEAEENAEASE